MIDGEFKFLVTEDLTCKDLGWEEKNSDFLEHLKSGLRLMRENGIKENIACYMDRERINELRGKDGFEPVYEGKTKMDKDGNYKRLDVFEDPRKEVKK